MPTHYEILGVSQTATPQDIKKAYRALALKHHPDKNLDDPESGAKFKLINAAHEILSDENLRAKYDASLKPQKAVAPKAPTPQSTAAKAKKAAAEKSERDKQFAQYQAGRIAREKAERMEKAKAQALASGIWARVNLDTITLERNMRSFMASHSFSTGEDKERFISAIKAHVFPDVKGLSSSDQKKLDRITDTAGDLFTAYQKQNSKQTSTLIGRLGNQIKSWFGKDVYSKFVRSLGQHLKAEIGAALDHHGLPRNGRSR